MCESVEQRRRVPAGGDAHQQAAHRLREALRAVEGREDPLHRQRGRRLSVLRRGVEGDSRHGHPGCRARLRGDAEHPSGEDPAGGLREVDRRRERTAHRDVHAARKGLSLGMPRDYVQRGVECRLDQRELESPWRQDRSR